jgi:hypothetical protein
MKIKIFTIAGFILITFILFSATCSAQNYEEYAPILYFESEETCFPIDAEFQLTYSYLYDVDNNLPISTDPSSIDLSSYSSDDYQYYYLDNQQGSPKNYDKIISDSKNWEVNNGNKVYYRNYYDSASGNTVIQYWMYYAFNNGELNKHEGDWEMVQIVFNGEEPSWVAYSKHHSGQRASWNQVEKEGNHIKVYVARGSHANYLRSFSGKLGISSDNVGANGKVLKNSDYILKNLDDPEQSWVNFRGRWGECGADSADFSSADVLGSNGPEGPKYREEGAIWDNPVYWGRNLPESNDLIFIFEWFIYNFVLIIVLITLAVLGLTVFLIYRRHKKYGLGPRIVSMFYIDGLNFKSIGNILCIIGIIIAVISLFNTWYFVSMDISELNEYSGLQSTGMQDLIKIHGIDGIQMSVPGENGFEPIATISIPFAIFIGIGLLFLVIATIGISHSKKLGWKYIWRGIRLIVPVILILLAIMAIGSFISLEESNNAASNTMGDILKSISSSPFGSQKTFYVVQNGYTISIPMRWGLGLGAQLLLVSAIIFIFAGILEMVSNTQFFIKKTQEKKGVAQMPNQQPVKQTVSSRNFCSECGASLKENAMYCTKCGKKQK